MNEKHKGKSRVLLLFCAEKWAPIVGFLSILAHHLTVWIGIVFLGISYKTRLQMQTITREGFEEEE